MTHDERCRAESTRDVIFLLQERRSSDRPGWVTLGVWLDRAEAEAWGESKSYDLGKKNIDWRVYGANAEGQLAALLRAQDMGSRDLAKAVP